MDLCGNQSISIVDACPIQLSGVLGTDNIVNLNWTDYDGWQSGVQNYSIEKYSDGGVLLQTIDAGTSISFTDDIDDPDNQIYVYIIKASSSNAALNQSVSNTIRITKDPKIFYPTAFTPNADGLNDYFLVSGQYIVDFRMNIFNRWGELIFSTGDITAGWDGRLNGKLVEEGTYVFNADLTDLAGRTFNRAGPFVLLRKK
jgi:gliding motility-associated-like protein